MIGDYDNKEKKTKIAWETDEKLPYKGEWYFCVYRKGENDKRHKFLMSVKADDRLFHDYLLSPGQSAEYYIKIKYADGRETTPSNIIIITAPKKEG